MKNFFRELSFIKTFENDRSRLGQPDPCEVNDQVDVSDHEQPMTDPGSLFHDDEIIC